MPVKRDFKSSLRLMITLLFILLQIPALFRFLWNKHRIPREGDLRMFIVLSICLLVYLILELLEYRIWNYRYSDRRLPRLLYSIRFCFLLLAIVFSEQGMGHPGISFYMILLVFYAYFAFPFPVSLTICILIIGLTVIYELFFDSRPEGITQTTVFFTTYKVLVMSMFYLFAYFWQKDRDASDKNRRLVEDLRSSRRQLEDYARMVGETAALEERTRLARDIHDSVGHALTAIQIQIAKAEAFQTINPEESRQALAEARDAAKEAMGDIRGSLTMLNDKSRSFSFKKDVRSLIRKLESSGCRVETEVSGEEEGFNYAVLMALYRLVQEGITNILKHAGAELVRLEIRFGCEELSLRLEDYGRGFDAAASAAEGHFGLEGLRNRVELVRGTLNVISEPGEGCVLEAVLPRDPVNLIGGKHE